MEMLDSPSLACEQHRLLHDIYILLDDGDRQVLDATGLTPLEFAVLQRLHRDQGRRLTDIGTELFCVKSTITRLVDRLEAGGLVRRTPDPDDRRAQRLRLTTRGVLVRDQAIRLHSEAVERRMAVLNNEEQFLLRGLLEKLHSGLR
ncbi:MarR family winged helix-turn-helix transcriptional regulator [Candidatus Viridilinea mediisalina]|nr:MarR family transcriptional regulator [Candidatus Viridilinea mediisalina]